MREREPLDPAQLSSPIAYGFGGLKQFRLLSLSITVQASFANNGLGLGL